MHHSTEAAPVGGADLPPKKSYQKPALTRLSVAEARERYGPQVIDGLLAEAQLARYRSLGLDPIPIPAGSKQTTDEGWPDRQYRPEDFIGRNIASRWSNGVVDVDVDALECVAAADAFLPPTSAVFGRASKPRSHRLYCCRMEHPLVLKNAEGRVLVEVRSGKNQYTITPPSRHPSGETIEWSGEIKPPAEVDRAALERAVRLLAATGLIAQRYPPEGARHDWCLGLAGTLRNLGVSRDKAERVVEVAATVAGDSKIRDRLLEVETTYQRGDDEPRVNLAKTDEKLHRTLSKLIQTEVSGKGGDFIRNQNGAVLRDNQDNVRLALQKLGVSVRRNLFSGKTELKHNGQVVPFDDDSLEQLWLLIDKQFRFRPSLEFFKIVLQDVARHIAYHPVREYLDSLRWDGVPRLDGWLRDYGGAEDMELVRAISAIVLIAAVRRVREPGCKFDEILVMISPQGWNKSTAIQTLCPERAWFSEELPLDADSKEVIERTGGKWIIEANELKGLSRRREDYVKSFLSRQIDGPARLAYARLPVERPRQFVVIGTCNPGDLLTDTTGNRRWWPVEVRRFDIEGLAAVRDQLWAEAAHREEAGESIRLDPRLYEVAAELQESVREKDPWEEAVANWLSGHQANGSISICSFEVLNEVLNKPTDRHTREDSNRLGRVGCNI